MPPCLLSAPAVAAVAPASVRKNLVAKEGRSRLRSRRPIALEFSICSACNLGMERHFFLSSTGRIPSPGAWACPRCLEILGKCLCHMFQMARQMSRHDMTCLATESWQMSRHVTMFRRTGENIRSARRARHQRKYDFDLNKKIPEIGEDRCSTRIDGLRIDIIRTTFLSSAAEILFKIIPTHGAAVATLVAQNVLAHVAT